MWANSGGDKVTQDELRSTVGKVVTSKVWDGSKVILNGSKNEVLGFNLVLESSAGASNVAVKFNQIGPIVSTGSNIYQWTDRPIELFYVQYLQVKGLSALSYDTYDERHVPKRIQRPWTGAGMGSGLWTDRPDHDKFYPDIMVPMELKPTFPIAANKSQNVWVDVYVPKTVAAGTYTGNVQILESGVVTKTIPVSLTVQPITLPDVPNSKTMLFIGGDMKTRYLSVAWPNCKDANDLAHTAIRNKHFQVAHRHKISLIDDGNTGCSSPGDQPQDVWIPRLDGSLFTAANNYDGPGVGVGNNIYSVGTYSSWGWKSGVTQATMAQHSGAWENWFKANSPSTERFLYIVDESTNYPQTEQWALWNKGFLKGFATLDLPAAISSVPSLDISTSWIAQAPTSWGTSAAQAKASGKQYWFYNGKRPATGSFSLEDDGLALEELPWAQWKLGVGRWFFWEGTYYNDYQGGRGQTNVFQTAATFSGSTTVDSVKGETGWNHTNGDGVLFYPGTDKIYPAVSYGVQGPFASQRMKMWRRGIQDVDYIALAYAKNPTATQAIVNQMVPKALWEYGVTDMTDPTWVRSDISWSIKPDDWDTARASLIAIILAP